MVDPQVFEFRQGRLVRGTEILTFSVACIVNIKITDLDRFNCNVFVTSVDTQTGKSVLGLKSPEADRTSIAYVDGIGVSALKVPNHLEAETTGKKCSGCRPGFQSGERRTFSVEFKMLQSLANECIGDDVCIRNVLHSGRFDMPGCERF